MAQHTVRTTHIQRLIENGLYLAQRCDNVSGLIAFNVPVPGNPSAQFARNAPVEHALQKAAADLRHAAEELEAERLSCLGWAQV